MMAMQKGTTQQVKDVGFALMVDHGRLDKFTRDLAQQMGLALPDQPSDEQRGWLGEEMAATGQNFDRIFANRLRAAHGAVLNVISQVRTGTRDNTIRAYATTANQAVMRHITLLESTGMVDYDSLPEPVVSATSAPAGGATRPRPVADRRGGGAVRDRWRRPVLRAAPDQEQTRPHPGDGPAGHRENGGWPWLRPGTKRRSS